MNDDEFLRLKNLSESDWQQQRSHNNYQLVPVKFEFGVRLTYQPIQDDSHLYEDLQGSRGLSLTVESFQALVNTVKDQIITINEIDQIRMAELEKFSSLETIFDVQKDFFELGFRQPKLLNYYANHFRNARGCDVVQNNVNVGQELGFSVERANLNKEIPSLKDCRLIISYHVFEHLFNPLDTMKKLHEAMDVGSLLHIEVPTEPGIPRLQYGHVFSFHSGDLGKMLTLCGFEVLEDNEHRHHTQPEIQRCLAKKV